MAAPAPTSVGHIPAKWFPFVDHPGAGYRRTRSDPRTGPRHAQEGRHLADSVLHLHQGVVRHAFQYVGARESARHALPAMRV